MRAHRMQQTIASLGLAVVSLAAGFFASRALLTAWTQDARTEGATETATETIRARWALRFDTLADLAAQADSVVLAEVVEVAPGRITGRASGRRGERGVFPYTDVRLRPLGAGAVLRGERPGEQFTLEVLGDFSAAAANPTTLEGLPIFERGQRYLLFVQEQTLPPHLWIVMNNQAVYRVVDEAEGRPEGSWLSSANPQDVVAKTVHGRSVADVVAEIAASSGE